METKERFVIEILLGLILIVFLIILVFLVIGISKNGKTQSPASVINSYNTNYYNSYQQPREYTTAYPFVQYMTSSDKNRYMRYDDASRLRKSEGLFENDIDNYEVYVRNEEFKGGYFEVTFYFEDYYGETSRSSVTHYIPAGEEKKFFYKDISPQRYKYQDWWYDVKSLSKVPAKVHYTDGDKDDVFYSRDGYYHRDGMMVYYFR